MNEIKVDILETVSIFVSPQTLNTHTHTHTHTHTESYSPVLLYCVNWGKLCILQQAKTIFRTKETYQSVGAMTNYYIIYPINNSISIISNCTALYIHIYTYTHTQYIYIYIYIYILCMCVCIYTYIYIYDLRQHKLRANGVLWLSVSRLVFGPKIA